MTKIENSKFKFGVATAGFQIEGGYNGQNEPANQWSEWETLGKVEPSGLSIDFWNRYEEHLDRIASLGCNSFRLSVEWSRVMPDRKIDKEAINHYRKILEACLNRGLEPLISILHFTTPAYLGVDPWLSTNISDHYKNWVSIVLDNFKDLCNNWVTLNEPNINSIMSYFTGMFPPGDSLKIKKAAASLNNQIYSHVLGYAAIKEAQPQSIVGINNFCFSTYELEKAITDILLAKHYNIQKKDLRPWLNERRKTYLENIDDGSSTNMRISGLLGKLIEPLKTFSSTVDLIYSLDFDKFLDVIQLDFYNPVTPSHFKLPGHKTAGGRNWLPGTLLWDDPPNPELFYKYLLANAETGLDLWVVENGMCNRVKNGRSFQRLDGWTRPQYLDENINAVKRAILDGVNVTGYWHWTYADNYEWGSYEPRFGIFGVDRERGIKILDTDSMGYDSASKYRTIIENFQQVKV